MKKALTRKKEVATKPDTNESIRLHRAINWVVSVILLVFAIWSITLNAEGRSLLKQATAMFTEIDTRVNEIKTEVAGIKSLCQPTTVVIPTTTTDTKIPQ